MKILYICSSQFSGTTLTSFLLNSHSAIATIGHTTGWRYDSAEDFRCSCGQKIRDCPLFNHVNREFARVGLTFDPQNFGTAFSLSENFRLNRLLTGGIPLLDSSVLEHFRDRSVGCIPAFRKALARQQLANLQLMQSVTNFCGADVYLDNSHSPFRLRMLAKNPELSVRPVHLIRDPRGVTLSMMRNSKFSSNRAIDSWLRHQCNIFRIVGEVASPLVIRYESLCTNTDFELARLHTFAGVKHEVFSGDFKEKPHHILGNRMRLTDGKIRLDERWRRELPSDIRDQVEQRLMKFTRKNMTHPLSGIIHEYLGGTEEVDQA